MRRQTVLTLLALGGCAPAVVHPGGGPLDDPCVIAPQGEALLDTVRIALAAPVRPLALGATPGDPAEALLAAALYGTLVETDCRGTALPGLASGWEADTSGTRWSFVLRPDATFVDGSPVTAEAVVAAWSDARLRGGRTSGGARARVQSVEVTGAGALTVRLDRRADVALFADPSLAVRRYAEPWPMGTGPYAVVSGDAVRRDYASVRLRLAAAHPPAGRDRPLELHFAVPPSGDVRNALDLDADVAVTRDAAVLEYARALADYATTPLPWDRTYLLLAPAATLATSVPEAALAELARDAVRGEARPARPLSAFADGPAFAAQPAARSTSPNRRSTRIVYQRDDDAARGLAERIVALAAAPGRDDWLSARLPPGRAFTAQPLDARALAAALTDGRDAAYIVGVPTHEIDTETRALLALPSPEAAGAASPAVVTPLVETRPTVIHRRALGPVRFDAQGTLRFGLPQGRAAR
jgi:hypothetical protein